MLVKQPKRAARVDISDLKADTVVVWQERNYVPLALLMGWGFPAALAGLCWNDWYGGLLYAGILRMFVTHQGVFCINSVCHYLGDQPYDDRLSPRNLPHVLALFTLGEGYHNFHHEFPSDYRNGVHWYDLDSTKWAIWVWEKLGLVRDLKRFRQNEIEKARLQQLQKVLNKRELQLQWGPSLKKLPVMDWKELKMQVETGRELVCISGTIHDISGFVEEHPGGSLMIRSFIGKDGSAAFTGGVYNHSKTAWNVLSTMRIAVLRNGSEERLKEK
jgi:stearoyl-CoA desaturase (delta-9 desaturase)